MKPIRHARFLTPVCLTLFLLVLALKIQGISPGDDSWYLDEAAPFHLKDFFHLHLWEPLYSVWFKVLALVVPNPVWRYLASWGLIVILISLVPVAMRMRYAWLYSFLFLALPLPFVLPYIGLFTGMLAVVAMCLVLRSPLEPFEALTAACFTCCLLGYCRSEFDSAVFVSAAATWIAVALAHRSGRRARAVPVSAGRLAGCAVFVAVLAGGTLYVAQHSVGMRSGIAFAQHFNRRAAMRGVVLGEGVWKSDYAERAFGIDAGRNASNGNASIGDFFRANPRLFLGHVFANLTDAKTIAVLLLVIAAVLWPWLSERGRPLRSASLFLLLLALPPIADVLVIFPRDHYFMLLLPALTIFALQCLPAGRWIDPPMLPVLILGALSMFFLDYKLPRLRLEPVDVDRTYASRINCLRTVDGTAPPGGRTVFASVAVRDVYLVHPREEINPSALPQWVAFKTWAQGDRPAWIAVADDLPAQYAIAPSEMQDFLAGELHYTAHPCPWLAHMTVYAPQ